MIEPYVFEWTGTNTCFITLYIMYILMYIILYVHIHNILCI